VTDPPGDGWVPASGAGEWRLRAARPA